MYEASLAQNSYASSIQSTGSDRSLEYRVFAQITQELSTLVDGAPDYPAKLAMALHRNLRLWTILAADVANENNELPADLRSKIFYLSEFTRQHTTKIRAGEADVKVLVDINTMIMRGLRARPAQEGEN